MNVNTNSPWRGSVNSREVYRAGTDGFSFSQQEITTSGTYEDAPNEVENVKIHLERLKDSTRGIEITGRSREIDHGGEKDGDQRFTLRLKGQDESVTLSSKDYQRFRKSMLADRGLLGQGRQQFFSQK